MVRLLSLVCLGTLLLAGCGKENALPREWAPRMSNPPLRSVREAENRFVDEMSPDDVVVAVNGVPLTKRELDIRLHRYSFMLSRNPNMSGKERAARYEMYGKTLIDSFVNEQVFAWEGRKAQVLTETQLRQIVASNVVLNAKAFRVKPDQIDHAVPGGLSSLCHSIEDVAWAKAYADKHVVPDAEIDDSVVSNVLAEVSMENARITASNRLVRAKAERIRSEIQQGKITFESAAERYSFDFVGGEEFPGHWGTFRPGDIEDRSLRQKLFSLELGELSDVIDDDEGYMIVRAVKDKGDARTFTRILFAHEPLVVLQDPKFLKRDLKNQMFSRGLRKLTAELCEKAQIVYPHGTNFWRSARAGKVSKAKSK